MSCGILRVQKMTAGSVKGIEIHDRREHDGRSNTNKDIDWSKSNQNYDLHTARNENFNHAVKDRISRLNLKRAVRKDAVVMAQVLVTSDHDFFSNLSKEKQTQFFQDSYDFLAERYGRENVISAIVHLDERTPHMHFNFVPVTSDGRLSAKSILTRQSLISQQTAFQEKVGSRYGLERGLQGGAQKHLQMAELKAQTALENAAKARSEEQSIQACMMPLQAEYAAKKAYVEKCDKASQVSVAVPDYAKVKKSIFGKQTVTVPIEKWEQKHVSANEKAYLKSATEAFEKNIREYRNTASAQYVSELEQKIGYLEREVFSLKKENVTLQNKLNSAEKETETVKDRINQVLSKMPESEAERFVRIWEASSRRSRYYSR